MLQSPFAKASEDVMREYIKAELQISTLIKLYKLHIFKHSCIVSLSHYKQIFRIVYSLYPLAL